MFMHMDAHRPMPSPPSASAHIVAAIAAAEHASTQPCIIDMSMPDMPAVPGIDMDFIMSAIMLIAARPLSSAVVPDPFDGTPRARADATVDAPGVRLRVARAGLDHGSGTRHRGGRAAGGRAR